MIEIRFASQGGTAEEAADDTYHELLDNHVDCSFPTCLSVEDVTRWAGEEVTVLFFVATTGQGEWPTAARPFWQALLQRDCPTLRLRFAIFGFGDSAYAEFNYAARRLESRLQQCGATRFLRTGLGDDQHDFGYAQELDPWFAELLPVLETHSAAPDPDRHRRFFPKEITSSSTSTFPLTNATVESNSRLTSQDHFQAVHHVSLYLDNTTPWVPGDVCAIIPVIDKELLARFCVCQDLDPQAIVYVESREESHIQPKPFTLETLFTHYFDISAVPKGRWFFQVMAQFTEDDEVRKEKLEEFGGRSLEAKDALFEYCKRPRRSIVEIFEDFPTTKVPLQMLVNIVPPLRAREYSIANACVPSLLTKTQQWCRQYRRNFHACSDALSLRDRSPEVELCIALVEYEKGPRQIVGTCSQYLRTLTRGDRIHAQITRGSMNLANLAPVIAVCPGTGLTPVRAMLQTRSHRDDVLFLGFRHQTKDFLYSEEWPKLANCVHTAFSRDDSEKKIYVQDLIELHGEEVLRVLDAGGVFFISGRSHPMPQQVRSSLLEVVQTHKNLSEADAERYLNILKKENRYITDTWG